jgi:hypothetical protein
VAQNRKICQFLPPAGSRPDARRGEARRASLLTSILGVVVVCVMSFAGSAASASAATTPVPSAVSAYWAITDGCVETTVSLGSTQNNSGPPTTFFYLSQHQSCGDSVRPVLTLEIPEQTYTGGLLEVNSGLTKARLVATIPVTCYAYEIGACDQELYNPGWVSLNLSWTSTGKPLNFPAEDGGTCTYRYGTATGSILLGGGVNLLATEGGTLLADRTETNIARKDRCI